eukprot:gene30451-38063_t
MMKSAYLKAITDDEFLHVVKDKRFAGWKDFKLGELLEETAGIDSAKVEVELKAMKNEIDATSVICNHDLAVLLDSPWRGGFTKDADLWGAYPEVLMTHWRNFHAPRHHKDHAVLSLAELGIELATAKRDLTTAKGSLTDVQIARFSRAPHLCQVVENEKALNTLNNPSFTAALHNEDFCDALKNPLCIRAVSTKSLVTLLENPDFFRLLSNEEFTKLLANPSFLRALKDPNFIKARPLVTAP